MVWFVSIVVREFLWCDPNFSRLLEMFRSFLQVVASWLRAYLRLRQNKRVSFSSFTDPASLDKIECERDEFFSVIVEGDDPGGRFELALRSTYENGRQEIYVLAARDLLTDEKVPVEFFDDGIVIEAVRSRSWR